MKKYISIDVETTGLSPSTDRIIEIGAVHFDETGQEISRYQQLINPQMLISQGAREVHGITDDEVSICPTFQEICREFLEYLFNITTYSGAMIVPLLAHNAGFDLAFLGREVARSGFLDCLFEYRVIDTLSFARMKNRFIRSHSLPNLIRAYNLPQVEFHRSIADCIHVKNLWIALNGPAEDHMALPYHRFSNY